MSVNPVITIIRESERTAEVRVTVRDSDVTEYL